MEALLSEISLIAPTRYKPHTRKAADPSPVIWILLVFASGYINRFGELTAEKTISSLKIVGTSVSKFIGKHKNDKPADVIFALPIPDSVTIVEAAVENADRNGSIPAAISELPNVYYEAIRLIAANRKDYFEQIKYLFNPVTETWEINYLVTKKSKEIVLGPRYYEPDHPLHARYKAFQEGRPNLESGKYYGVSIGGIFGD